MKTWSVRGPDGLWRSLEIKQGDITTMALDAIVNAANPELEEGGGVCGAIYDAAGVADLTDFCEAFPADEEGVRCPVGQAVITPGCDLPASYIIHSAGPIWRGGQQAEAQQLAACYRNCLALAAARGLKSVAFPAISCGIYGYPIDEAAAIALAEVTRVLSQASSLERVCLVVFSERDRKVYEERLEAYAPKGCLAKLSALWAS